MGKVKDFLKNNWGLVLMASVGVLVVYDIFKTSTPVKIEKKAEEKSGFDGTESKIVQFTLTNNTGSEQRFPLFKSIGGGVNPNVGIMPSMSFFNQTLAREPKLVKAMEFRSINPNGQAQVTKLISKVCKDASGEESKTNYFPMVSVNQYQGNITVVQPDNLILDGECYLEYTLNPNTIVSLTMVYDIVIKGDMGNLVDQKIG